MNQSVRVSTLDASSERELLLSALRVAALRSRVATNTFDTVGIALKGGAVDCAGALAWLKEEGLLDAVPFGPEIAR
jgi:hypothetical protein